MQEGEARAAQSVAIKVFLRSAEAPFVPKPKTAWVAVKGGKIAGGYVYTIETCGEKKFGSVDFFFVDPAYAGQGIGRELCEQATEFLWGLGCDYLITSVRDDNVKSWRAFETVGFTRARLPKIMGALGLLGSVKAAIKNFHGFNTGCDIYFAVRPGGSDDLSAYAKLPGGGQLALHILANTALLMFLMLRNETATATLAVLPAVVVIFGGIALLSYIGTLFSARGWRYRLVNGGLITNLALIMVGLLFPVAGNWHPERYENTPEFRADMGLTALLPWLYLIAMFVTQRLFGDGIPFPSGLFTGMAGILLTLRCIPVPLINQGGVRLFLWSKPLWVAMAAASIYIVYFW